MKEILMMKKTHNNLLPLRGKISPPTILNCLNQSTEQKNYKSRETTKPEGGRERLFSASTMSASSSKQGSTFSERALTPPFTPPANGDRTVLFRRPSEHFLEVLEEHKQKPTVPKVRRSSSCLPPLGKTTQGEESQKKNLRGTKIAFSGYLNGEEVVSRQVESNGGRLLVVSEQRSDPTTTNLANKKILRKSQSLPLIKPYTAFTTGVDCVNVSVFESHSPSDMLNEEQKLNTCDRMDNAPIEEYLEELRDEGEPLEQDDEEETLEKFSMICHWLKECEKAKVV